MKILCFSDWRTQKLESIFNFMNDYERFYGTKIDLVLYGGDDLSRFKTKKHNYLSEIAKKTSKKKVLLVNGNDEYIDINRFFNDPNIIDLHRKTITLENVSFIGQEATTSGISQIRHNEKEVYSQLRNKLLSLPKKTIKILLTHTPPRNHLDLAIRFENKRIGSTSISRILKKLDFVICGHVHNQGGKKEIFYKTQIVNIASMEGHLGRFLIIDTITKKTYFFDERSFIQNSPLRKLKNVSFNRIREFNKRGVFKLEEINETNRKKISLKFAGKKLVDYWIKQSELIRKGKLYFNSEQLKKDIGKNYILYDLETDLTQNNVFIIGLYCSEIKEFKQIFEKNNMKKLLSRFDKYCKKFAKNSRLISYSNCNLEKRIISKLAVKYGKKEIFDLIQKEIDLGIKIRDYIIGDLPSLSLKDLASFLGYKYNNDLSGEEVGSLYSSYLKEKKNPNWKKIKEHNLEDIKALKYIIDVVLEKNEKNKNNRGYSIKV